MRGVSTWICVCAGLVLAMACVPGQARLQFVPHAACGDMAPRHAGVSPRRGDPGLIFQHDMCQGYQASKRYNIRIQVVSGGRPRRFQGFFCRVQRTGTTAEASAVGVFHVSPNSRTRHSDCNLPWTAVSHSHTSRGGSTYFDRVDFDWVAPRTDEGILQIVCTVAFTREEYYVGIRSGDVHFNPTPSVSHPFLPSSQRTAIRCTLGIQRAARPPTPSGQPGPCTQTCPAGPKGSVGEPGRSGPAGLRGPAGSAGRRGYQGSAGNRGDIGDAGQTGYGQKGSRGVRGLLGVAGVRGPRGDRGEEGVPGYAGQVGDPGPSARAGSAAVGPRGAPGIRGDVGDHGWAGAKGQAGGVGRRGNGGATGPWGAKGERGVRGLNGLPGPLGEIGTPGISGPAGRHGRVGRQGAKGKAGDDGTYGLSTTELQAEISSLNAKMAELRARHAIAARMKRELAQARTNLSAITSSMTTLMARASRLERNVPLPPLPPRCPVHVCPAANDTAAAPCTCRSPLGLESRKVKDDQLTTSAAVLSGFGPEEARLNVGAGWIPLGKGDNYLQIDFGQSVQVTGVVTQGMANSLHYVSSYSVSFQDQDGTWVRVRERGRDKVCTVEGSIGHGTATCHLDCTSPTRTSKLRIHPITAADRVMMRVEILGCAG